MESITKNEFRIVLVLFKEFFRDYNANSLSKKLGLTSMGTLKILKNLEKKGIVNSKQFGKAFFYKLNFESDYVQRYLDFILQKEAIEASSRVKRWVNELKSFKKFATIGILFGSVLKSDKFKDVDLLLILDKQKNVEVNKLM